MDVLKDLDLSLVVGGGYWWQDSAGYWHYTPGDEEPEGDDVVIG